MRDTCKANTTTPSTSPLAQTAGGTRFQDEEAAEDFITACMQDAPTAPKSEEDRRAWDPRPAKVLRGKGGQPLLLEGKGRPALLATATAPFDPLKDWKKTLDEDSPGGLLPLPGAYSAPQLTLTNSELLTALPAGAQSFLDDKEKEVDSSELDGFSTSLLEIKRANMDMPTPLTSGSGSGDVVGQFFKGSFYTADDTLSLPLLPESRTTSALEDDEARDPIDPTTRAEIELWKVFIQARLNVPRFAISKLPNTAHSYGYFTPLVLMDTTRAFLRENRKSWSKLTDPEWELLLQVRDSPHERTVEPIRMENFETVSDEPIMGAAEVVAQAFNHSLSRRATHILLALVGLDKSDDVPTPTTIMKLPLQSESWMSLSPGERKELLRTLRDHRLMESITSGSLKQYKSGIHSWIHFCDIIGVHPRDQLEAITQENTELWASTHRNGQTLASYISHLKLMCHVAKLPTDWDTPSLRKIVRAVRNSGNPNKANRTRWALRRERAVLMIAWANGNGYYWLALPIALCWNFQFRCFSELFKLLYTNCEILGRERQLGKQSLRLTVDRRKNRRYKHSLTRHCSSLVVKNDIPGTIMCPVRNFETFVEKAPIGKLRIGSPQLVPAATLMTGINSNQVNPLLKEAARAIGDPDWEGAGSHGPRRGAACDLAADGGNLAEILAAGDWKSAAFKTYLGSIQDDLAGDAILSLLADQSEEEDDLA